jgi:hypothetical protein
MVPILFAIAAAAVVLGLGIGYLFRGRREAQQRDLLERRVAAYMETIRRERNPADLVAMNDLELHDLLLSSAHNLRMQADRRWYLLLGGAVVAFVSAIIVGTHDGTRGFAITMLVGAVALYGLYEFLGRRMRAPLVERGIDVERLRVE